MNASTCRTVRSFSPSHTVRAAAALGLVLSLIFTGFAGADDVESGLTAGMDGTGGHLGEGDAVDASGNVYTTELFQGTQDFDPGLGKANLTSSGEGISSDIFASRLSVEPGSLGDVNGDGFINSTDALWIIQYEFGMRDGLTNETADLNGDGSINSTDALWGIQIEFGLRLKAAFSADLRTGDAWRAPHK